MKDITNTGPSVAEHFRRALPPLGSAGSLRRFQLSKDNMGAARYVWMDDSLRPASEGVVPFLSAGMQYGFSVFEGIRCYLTDQGPAVFRMNEHVEGVSGSGGERTRHPRQYCVVHASASEHHDDQGQGLGKLCELDSGQDGVA